MTPPTANRSRKVAVNGRILVQGSPPARLQAQEIVRALSLQADLEVSLFLPSQAELPEDLDELRRDLDLPGPRLGDIGFDQWSFPRAAARDGAHAGFFLHASAPLVSSVPTVAVWDATDIPGGSPQPRRFSNALALAALSGAAAVVRPTDVTIGPDLPGQTRVPPLIPRGFAAAASSDLRHGSPDRYVLAVCPPRAGLPLLLSAWTWVEGSLGDSCSLLVAGLDVRRADEVNQLAARLGVNDTVRTVDVVDRDWPQVVGGAGVVLHAGDSATAVVLRWAMAAGVPVAGIDNRLVQAILGPAGYLVGVGDSRALGAACLTLLVEEEVAVRLRRAGQERVAPSLAPKAATAWRDVILRLAPRG